MSVYTSDDVDRLTKQLADRAQITLEQAQKVMQALHLPLLVENSRIRDAILNSKEAVNALGIPHAENKKRLTLEASSVSIDDVRLTVKPPGQAAIMV